MNKKFIFPAFIVLMGAAVLVISLYNYMIIDKRLPVGSAIPDFEIQDQNTKEKIGPDRWDDPGKINFIMSLLAR